MLKFASFWKTSVSILTFLFSISIQALPTNLEFRGTVSSEARFRDLIITIQETPIGRETLQEIEACGHRLRIVNTPSRLSVSGVTRWVASQRSYNGIGLEAEILFDFRIPDSGSHAVEDMDGGTLEFTAAQNLFHELAHARHALCGTIWPRDIERQAIYEENIFRREQAVLTDQAFRPRTYDITRAQQIWFPKNIVPASFSGEISPGW